MIATIEKKNRTTEPTAKATMSKGVNIALWIVQLFCAFAFFFSGGGKLLGEVHGVEAFNAIGIGQWFRYFVGIIELTGAVLLLMPTLSGIGALLLSATMVGAVMTHFLILGGNAVPAMILLALVVIVAYGRRQTIFNFVESMVG